MVVCRQITDDNSLLNKDKAVEKALVSFLAHDVKH